MTEPPVLVMNCGSSSLKMALVEPQTGTVRLEVLAERLGTPDARLLVDSLPAKPLTAEAGPGQILELVLPHLQGHEMFAVGHRVVHGGEAFSDSALLDEHAVEEIRKCVKLAPLHNPANLLAIEASMARFPNLPQVAVFDTAFHQTLPPKAFLYAVPYELYEQEHVRRYGFHGSSHGFVANEAAQRMAKPLSELELVTAHLGNGCSTCAIKRGRSVDTSMGLTPLEGLVMGTRSGDVDPNLHQYLSDSTGQSLEEVTELLNRKSGLLGLSGLSNDMRTLLEAAEHGHVRAGLAVDVFCYRLAKSILAQCAALERVDALVFTGGIGEHAASARSKTVDQLRVLGAKLDPETNRANGQRSAGVVSAADSALLVLVIPTNEQLVIAREAARIARAPSAEPSTTQ